MMSLVHKLAQQKDNPAYKYVKAFGLVGDESANRLTEYSRALNIAWNEAGLGLAPHVAEQCLLNAPDFLAALPEETRDIEEDDDRRIRAGHGTLIHMSDRLVEEFAERSICLESCISANKRIGLPEETRILMTGDEIGDTGYKVDRPAAGYQAIALPRQMRWL